MGPVVRRHARPGDPCTTVRRHPARVVGAAHPAAAQHDPRGGPRPPVGRGGKGMATGGPGATSRVEWGSVLAYLSAHPPRIVLDTANVLRATEIHTWGRDAATIRWQPREDGAAPLAVAHFNTGGPVYDDALSLLRDTLGPILLMLPTDLAAALRHELDSCDGLRAGWEAVADGNLLALLHCDAADECQWGTLVPHLTGCHMYMATPPQGHPRLAWDDLIVAFHDHGILSTTRGRRSGRRRSATTTGAA